MKKSMFDSAASTYASMYNDQTRVGHFFRSRLECLSELFDEETPSRLLEIGCGPGILVDELVNRGFDYHGVDASSRMIEECNRLYGSLEAAKFDIADMQELPFQDSEFDVVLCIGALEYLEDEKSGWDEIHRVLKLGGIAILSGMNALSPYNLWHRYIYRHFTYLGSQGMLREFGTEETYRRMGESCEMTAVDALYFDFSLIPPPLDNLLIRQANWAADKLAPFGRSRFRRFANGFLMKFASGSKNH